VARADLKCVAWAKFDFASIGTGKPFFSAGLPLQFQMWQALSTNLPAMYL